VSVTVSGQASSPAQAQAQAAQVAARTELDNWNRVNAGTLRAQVRIGIDGKPAHSVRVIEVPNPAATVNLIDVLTRCEYAPGRYHGVVVPAFIVTSVSVPVARGQ